MAEKTAADELQVEEASGMRKGLKRSGSWKRFKETVKETVQSWVGNNNQVGLPDQPGVPSAVFPDQDVHSATTNVDRVLHATNCYSGGGLQTPTPQLPDPHQIDIPRIVVTSDERSPSPRRTSTAAVQIRPAVSQPELDEASHSLPSRFASSNTPQSTGSATPSDSEEAEMKRRMAVMKIKQAIAGANSETNTSLLQSVQTREIRRHSDTTQIAAVAAEVAAKTPPSVRRSESTRRAKSGSLTPSQREMIRMRRRSAADVNNDEAEAKPPSRSGSMKKSKKAKPMIWEHFDTVPNTSLQGKCRACHMTVSCKYNTGNFVRHLQVAHMDIYRQYQSKMENQWTRSMLERNLK